MVTMGELAARRQAVMKHIGQSGVVIIPAAQEVHRNSDAVYPYRQHSDFYYLTGFNEPEAVLVLAPGRPEGEFVLFNRVRDPEHEIWDGPRAGQAGACEQFKADQSFPIADFKNHLPDFLMGRETIHTTLGALPWFDATLMNALQMMRAKVRTGLQAPFSLTDIDPILHEMRLIKTPAEIALMQQAVDITGSGHVAAMKACRPGLYEYALEAELSYAFQRQGARFSAYNAIVGSGKNTCILHYVNNNARIQDGDLVLIDAGAEIDNYAADITRTFPANGKFTGEQRAIYELVLASQLAGIGTIKPGAPWDAAQTAIVKCLTQGLVDLGILSGNVDSLIEKEAYTPYYMHRSGHWLGLDVHDVGRYKLNDQWRALQAGMALTVEPGLYLSSDCKGLPERWHNIGVRIEDDVLVTASGCDVLSHAIPKTVDDIEAVMRHAGS
ncbi:MAG TPA: Xaa-Pro aminopeptidase [Gammaproteobacteria bacterium]|nr:Xaa-Pro aminopeptidase [Gammaproteobacteria bacterium]